MTTCNFPFTYGYTPQVVEEHPEWLYNVVDVVLNSIETSINSHKNAELDPLTLIGDICTVIRDTVTALFTMVLLPVDLLSAWASCPNSILMQPQSS